MLYCKCIDPDGDIDWYCSNKNIVWPKRYGEVSPSRSVSQGPVKEEAKVSVLLWTIWASLEKLSFLSCIQFLFSLAQTMFNVFFFFFPAIIVKICFSSLTMCRLAWLWLMIQQLLYRMGKKCMFSYAFLKIILNTIFCFLFLWWNSFRSKFTQSYFVCSMWCYTVKFFF